jgi:hypothetical protein
MTSQSNDLTSIKKNYGGNKFMGEIFSRRLSLPAIFHALSRSTKSSGITHSLQYFTVHHTTTVTGAGAGVLHSLPLSTILRCVCHLYINGDLAYFGVSMQALFFFKD